MLAYFAKTIRKQKSVESFSEQLWNTVTDYVTVYGKEEGTFLFKGGTEIEIAKEKEWEGQ